MFTLPLALGTYSGALLLKPPLAFSGEEAAFACEATSSALEAKDKLSFLALNRKHRNHAKQGQTATLFQATQNKERFW